MGSRYVSTSMVVRSLREPVTRAVRICSLEVQMTVKSLELMICRWKAHSWDGIVETEMSNIVVISCRSRL